MLDESQSKMQKSGPELVEEIGKHVTLDSVLDRDPHASPLDDSELRALVVTLRGERAAIEAKSEEKRQKKRDKQNETE
jgi:hypothetical protein